MQYDRAQMKTEVKAVLGQTKPSPLLATALFSIILALGNALVGKISAVLSGSDYSGGNLMGTLQTVAREGQYLEPEQLLTLLGGVVATAMAGGIIYRILHFIWTSLMDVGYEGYSLSMERGEGPAVTRVFCGFPKIGGVLLTRLLRAVFVFLWRLLFSVAAVLLLFILAKATGASKTFAFLAVLVAVAAAVACIWVELRYAFTDYALLDHQVTGMEAIRASKELMKGNAGRLFVLRLSFFGWGLLMGAITFVGTAITALLAGGQALSLFQSVAAGSASTFQIIRALGVASIGVALAAIANFLLDLWLRPYKAGCEARLYDMALTAMGGSEPVQASPAPAAAPAPAGGEGSGESQE